jgi:DNA-binding beta-propeller fold protein YncE
MALSPVLAGRSQDAPGPYRVIKTIKVGGDGGFDWPIADAESGKLYIPRSGSAPRVLILDLNTFAPIAEIPNVNARTVAADGAYHMAFSSSSPVAMWDTRTNTVVKTIPIEGRPAGIMADEFNHRIYIQGRREPGLTVLDAKDGTVLGTIPVGGEIEQCASDGKGTIYVDIEDRQSIVVIDAKAMKIKTGTKRLSLDPKTGNVYMISADYGPPTLNADGAGKSQKGEMTPGSFTIIVVGK